MALTFDHEARNPSDFKKVMALIAAARREDGISPLPLAHLAIALDWPLSLVLMTLRLMALDGYIRKVPGLREPQYGLAMVRDYTILKPLPERTKRAKAGASKGGR